MSRVNWRWAEKDFGFRFRSGGGRSKPEYYQARAPGTFYIVQAGSRKLSPKRIEELNPSEVPTAPQVVPMPWRNYERGWDWITSDDEILLNYAGCLDREEIHRREDEGVARAMEMVTSFLERPQPLALTNAVIQQVHVELMGAIYPFAGAWRQVGMTKGAGPEKWPLPPGGIGNVMQVFERDVLGRSPVLSDDDAEVIGYVSEVMGELLAIHPFREGNGRTAFIIGNFLLMQNNLLPLDVYDRRNDEERYYAACEDVRIHKRYDQLAALISEWQEAAQTRWEASGGQ